MARFIKYYDMYDHWLFGNSDYFKWWFDLIYLANWEDKKALLGNKVVVVERGQLAWSQLKLSERWKCSIQNVRTFLNLLEKDEMIAREYLQKTNSKITVISICNYSEYQDNTKTKQQLDNSETTARQPQDNSKPTADQQLANPIHRNNIELLERLEKLEGLLKSSCAEPEGSPQEQPNSKPNLSAISPVDDESATDDPLATAKEADSEDLGEQQRPGKEPSEHSGGDGIGTIAKSEVVFELPLNEINTFHQVTRDDMDEFEELFQAVDILQELKLMRKWFKDNPQKKKTKTGIGRFMTTWLAKKQNAGGTAGYLKINGSHGPPIVNGNFGLRPTFAQQREMNTNAAINEFLGTDNYIDSEVVP